MRLIWLVCFLAGCAFCCFVFFAIVPLPTGRPRSFSRLTARGSSRCLPLPAQVRRFRLRLDRFGRKRGGTQPAPNNAQGRIFRQSSTRSRRKIALSEHSRPVEHGHLLCETAHSPGYHSL